MLLSGNLPQRSSFIVEWCVPKSSTLCRQAVAGCCNSWASKCFLQEISHGAQVSFWSCVSKRIPLPPTNSISFLEVMGKQKASCRNSPAELKFHSGVVCLQAFNCRQQTGFRFFALREHAKCFLQDIFRAAQVSSLSCVSASIQLSPTSSFRFLQVVQGVQCVQVVPCVQCVQCVRYENYKVYKVCGVCTVCNVVSVCRLCWVYTAYSVYNVHHVYNVYSMHCVRSEHPAHSAHTVHTAYCAYTTHLVHIVLYISHTLYTLYTCYSLYTLYTLYALYTLYILYTLYTL